ncbi:Helitron helicase [Phytophthora megakarya]|uniref:ATP-dependent DNA helicase n=1 Tax=Phytophthora megakarya TaxID=4795 RepID=A0A225W049_9STRA|nr:Helitron helicase [Phytophthora megakarya]
MAEYKALKYLAHYLASNGKTLEVYGLSELRAYSDVSAEVDGPATESIVQQELNAYSQTDLEHVTERVGQLNRNQRDVFDQVVRAVEHPGGGEKLLFFLDGPASNGIAASLLTGGHTAHSTFRIPLRLTVHSTCSLSWQGQKAELIRNASLIIWDEAPMMNRGCFEAVDRTFRDIMKNESEPFGGKVIVFSGDHRQILPELKDATRAETIAACFKSSDLWEHLREVRLTENMRVRTAPDPGSAADLAVFSEFLLQNGEGQEPVRTGVPKLTQRLRNPAS